MEAKKAHKQKILMIESIKRNIGDLDKGKVRKKEREDPVENDSANERKVREVLTATGTTSRPKP